MGVIERYFRLTNEPGGLGLSCTASGLSLAGVPLLRKSETGFAPRPAEEIDALVEAAYGDGQSAADLLPSFDAVARALNRGELAHAMIAAVLTRMPELSWDAAARIANAEGQVRKYNPDEPRDWHGCWTSNDSTDVSGQDKLPEYPVDFGPEDDDEPVDNRSPLERKYDDLGPVEFARQVIQFGDQLGRNGQNLSPDERQDALAEYNFLQNRLSFWLGYGDKPFLAQANLLSASQVLFEGAINGKVISADDGFPPSMLYVALGLVGQDNHQPEIRFQDAPLGDAFEHTPVSSQERPVGELSDATEAMPPSGEVEDVIDSSKAGIDFDNDIADKGLPLETYLATKMPGVRVLEPGTKVFDLVDDASGQAISVKVLDPLSYGYINNPQTIYNKIRGYVNAAANYSKPRAWFDLDPSRIKSKVIHLGVRDYISPAQWRQLNRAVLYGKSRGVSVVITRIR